MRSEYLSGNTVTVSNNSGGYRIYFNYGDWSGKTLNYVVTGNANINCFEFNGNLNFTDANGNLLDYTKTVSGYDVVLTVGDNTITLQNATNLDTININGAEVSTSPFEVDSDGNRLIQSANDLMNLSTYVTNGHNCEGLTFKLTADIDMTGKDFTPIGNTWGDESASFKGTFDGAGHTISGLNISDSQYSNVGLFRFNFGTIKNLNVSGTVSGNQYIGGLIGSNGAGTITGNKVDAQITGTSNVGALVGATQNTVTSSGNYFHSNQTAAFGYKETYYDASGKNISTDIEGTKVYAITAPEHFTISDVTGGIEIGGKYFAPSGTVTVKLASADGIHRADETCTVTDSDVTVEATNIYIQLDADHTTYTVAQGEKVVCGEGNDTITVGEGVTEFTVENFGAGDEIQNVSGELSAIDGGVKVGNVTISGLTLPTTGKVWQLDGTTAKYGDGNTAGAKIIDGKIVYAAAEVTNAEIELDGITDTTQFNVGNTKANLNAANFGENVSVKSNSGNYTFYIFGTGDFTGKTFKGLATANTIENYAAGLVIQTFDGNDSISNNGSNASINAGDGDNTINNSGSMNTSISVGTGNDSIYLNGSSNSLTDAGGNNQVTLNGGSHKVTLGAGADTISLSGSSHSLDAGDGENSIVGSSNSNLIIVGKDKNLISLTGSGNSIQAGDGNNSIYGAAANKITVGGGADYISLTGAGNNVSAGDGNNTISVTQANTITAGTGDDSISVTGAGNMIDAGAGTNTIHISEHNVIDAATGDNLIKLDASNINAFSIAGFGVGDSIELATEVETIGVSDYGNALTVGNMNIVGINSLATAQNGWVSTQDGFKYQTWTTAGATLDDTGKKISYAAATDTVDHFTIAGVDTDKVEISGEKVIISRDAVKGTDITLTPAEGKTYALELAYDVPQLSDGKPSVTADAQINDGNYIGTSYSEYYTLTGNTAKHHNSSGGETITITRQADITDDMINGAIVQSGELVDGQYKVSYTATIGTNILDALTYGEELTFGGDIEVELADNLGETYHKSTWGNADASFDANGNYMAAITTRDYFSNTEGKIKHEYQVGGTTFAISGADTSKVTVDGATVKLSADSFTGDEIILTDNNDVAVENQVDYKLSLGDLPTTGKEISATFSDYTDGKYIYTAAGTETFYALDGNKAARTPQVGGETFEFGGLNLGTLTVDASGNVTSSTLNEVIGTLNDKTFTLSNIKVLGNVADGATKEFTFDGKNNFNLILGEDFGGITPTTLGADKLVQQGEAVNGLATYEYISPHDSAYTEQSGNTYTYHAEAVHDEVIISNLKAGVTGDYKPVGKVFKLNADILPANEAIISISDGEYTLELDGVSAHVTTPEGWNGATYQSSYVSAAGYTLAEGGKSISYTPATTPTDLFSLNGVDSATGFEVSKIDDKYTVNISALNYDTEKTITLDKKSSDVSLAYANSFSGNKEKTVAQAASLENGTYTSKTYQAWSELNGESLTIHPATTAKIFTIINLSSAAKLEENVLVTDGDTTEFEFKAAALDKKSVTINGDNFSVKLTGDVDTEAETITESKTLSGGTLNYTASGTGEHYTATNSGVTYTEQVGGETFTLSGIINADGVEISGGTVTVNETALDMTAATTYEVKLDGNEKFNLDFKGNTSNAETPAELENGTYTSAYTPAYFNGSGKTYTFTPATAKTTFTISGLGENAALANDNVKVENKTITLYSKAISANHSKLTLTSTDDYNLTLDDAIKQGTINFEQNDNSVTLSGTTAGYKNVNDSYEWQEQVGGEELTITGLKDGATLTENMFTRNGNIITFKPTDELLPDNPTTLSITGGVIDTSALTTTKSVAAHWSGTTYISEKKASSWTSGAATVTYTAATGGEELFTLNDLKSGVTEAELSAAIEVGDKTLTIKSDAIFDTGKKITAPSGYNFKITDTNGHYAYQDGTGYTLATTNNANGYSDLIRVYEVTLPAFVSVASGISAKDGGKTYAAGEITLSGTKTGYTVQNSATITEDTTITATLDDTKHYIFGTEGNYTVATAENVAANNYPDLTQVYKVTLPSGITVTSNKYAVGNDTYVAVNAPVTIAATDANKLIKSATVEGGTLTNGVYTLTATKDLEVTAPILIWDFAKVFANEDGTSDKPYTLDTATKLGYLTDNVSAGEDYSGEYFSLTSGIGSEVKNIGDTTNQFKGTATLGTGVKVSFNGGATIEAVSGEISFNASTSTFDSLDSDDKFKVGDTEYTVGDGCILQSGKVWLNPSTVTLEGLSTENNWTATVDGTITLTAAANKDFYGTDGKKVASFDGTTLTKANDSSTAIIAINASALTSPITINGFYNENTTITAGTGGVNVNVGDNKFSVVNGAFKFDGSKLISGVATLSTANDAVKVGDNLITLTSGDGITVNATDSTLGSLNSGDKFKVGTDSYEVAANGIIKILSGNVDILWNGTDITDDRKEYMIFSKPYMENRQILIVPKGNPQNIHSVGNLEGKIVGTQAGSSSRDYIDANPNLKNSFKEFKTYLNFKLAFADLYSGNVDVLICDELAGRYEISKLPERFTVVEVTIGSACEIGIGFRKDDVELRDKVQKVFDEMIKDGTAKKISEQWFQANLIKYRR